MRIGISGHQNLGSKEDVLWIQEQILTALSDYAVFVGISSLAVGADQIFAQSVLDLKQALEAIIPCRNYERTFRDAVAIQAYESFRSHAARSFVMAFEGPSEEAFNAAGRHIVENVNLMIFVWNGLPAKGLGGTADIVKYATIKKRSYIHINPPRRTVTTFKP